MASIIAQMGRPDMRLPILYALMRPERAEVVTESLDLLSIGRSPSKRRIPKDFLPQIGLQQWKLRTMPVVLNAADEIAVEKFLNRRLPSRKYR